MIKILENKSKALIDPAWHWRELRKKEVESMVIHQVISSPNHHDLDPETEHFFRSFVLSVRLGNLFSLRMCFVAATSASMRHISRICSARLTELCLSLDSSWEGYTCHTTKPGSNGDFAWFCLRSNDACKPLADHSSVLCIAYVSEQVRLDVYAFFTPRLIRRWEFFAGNFWFVVQTCHRGSHHALRDSASEFWVCRFVDSESQKQKHSPTAELRICCGMWLSIWLTRRKTTKFSSKFHCRTLLALWRLVERSVLFLVAGRHVLLRAFSRMGCNLRHKRIDFQEA